MAKKDTEIEPIAQNTALEEVDYSDLVRDAGKGAEEVSSNDVKPPRIRICQAGSPQRKIDDAKQIPGLNELDIFNDLTGENYGRGPLKFIVLKALPARFIEFAPIEEGGGVVDFDVKWNDPRAQFTTDEQGKRQKPIATKFLDFLVFLPDNQEVALLSMKGSQLPVAVQLNSKATYMLKGESIHPSLKGKVIMNPPMWARTFSVRTIMDRGDGNSWGNYQLTQEGITPHAMRELCSQIAASYANKNIVVEREPGDEDAFDPTAMDAKAEM